MAFLIANQVSKSNFINARLSFEGRMFSNGKGFKGFLSKDFSCIFSPLLGLVSVTQWALFS